MDRTARPTGRDEVYEAVVTAATRQFSAKGMAASMRDIAEDAGVNVGLIHRHIGNKDDLLRAVVDRQVAGASTLLAERAADEVLPDLVDGMTGMTDYVRIMAWRLLGGEEPAEVQVTAPILAGLRDRATTDAEMVDLLSAVALIHGWLVFGPQLLAGSGRPDLDADTISSRLREVVIALARHRID